MVMIALLGSDKAQVSRSSEHLHISANVTEHSRNVRCIREVDYRVAVFDLVMNPKASD